MKLKVKPGEDRSISPGEVRSSSESVELVPAAGLSVAFGKMPWVLLTDDDCWSAGATLDDSTAVGMAVEDDSGDVCCRSAWPAVLTPVVDCCAVVVDCCVTLTCN